MRLRSKLFQLGIGAVIPPLLLALVIGILLVEYQRTAFRNGALDRTRAFMTSVDAEIYGHIAVLRSLAAAKSLEADDLREFDVLARRVLQTQPDWQAISLSLPSGEQLTNTRRTFGTQMPMTVDMESMAQAARTGQPVVGNVTVGPVSQTWGIPIRLPYSRNGSTRYVLTAIIEPSAFERLIRAQNLPATYVSGLVDHSGHFVARVPTRSPADMASKAFLESSRDTLEGWYRGLTVEGLDTYSAYRKSEFTHWTVGVGIPAQDVNASANHAALLVAIGTVLTFAIAFTYAFWMSRRIAKPISALATAARALGHGSPGPLVADPQFQEVRDVAGALEEANSAIRERQQFVEREREILRAADRAKDEFLAMLGHELRNPLSAVANAAILLNRGDLPEANRVAAQAIILRQTEQLTHLVNDLLDVGRVVAGKIRLERSRLELGNLARDAVAAFKATGRAEGNPITVHCEEQIQIQGDRTRIDQVIANLLSNAVNFAPTGGTVSVSVSREGGFAVLRVADTGVGLDSKDLDSIFELFFQTDKGLHRKGGLGIGLTLVKRIVELHGGTVSAASPGLDGGSTFTVKLPALADGPVATLEIARQAPALQPLHILVIDDSEDARESMALLLQHEGHRVDLAADGYSGLAAAIDKRPAVALVDIGMPGMNGYELARELRKQLQDGIVLIAMTGYGQAEDVRRATDAGFDAHLVKPVDFVALNRLLATLGASAGRSADA